VLATRCHIFSFAYYFVQQYNFYLVFFLILIAGFCHDISTLCDIQSQGIVSVHFTKTYTKVELQLHNS